MKTNDRSIWPELDYTNWKASLETLNRWMQVVGKVRLSLSPWFNHSWHSTLYLTETGLTTSVIHHRDVSFSIDFDFIVHALRIQRSDGTSAEIPLLARPVSDFYRSCFESLRDLGIQASIFAKPNELPDMTPFDQDIEHRSYDAQYAHRFWRILLQCDRLMKEFRSHYSGKVSPVHFFWGSLDLAVTRFSGRRAPEHPGGIPHLPDLVTREAYSHEVSSCGFWPGNERFPEPAFYSYAYPQPPGFERTSVPKGAYFHEALREFVLPYQAVRSTGDPDALVLDFFQKTYEAAANLGGWDRALLEESPYLKELQEKRKKAA